MVHKKNIFILLLTLPLLVCGQFDNNKHIIGPSIGFSFLGSSLQLGINYEYSIDANNFGISPCKVGLGGVFRYWTYSENFSHVNWSYTDIILGLQSNYHFYLPNESLDPWIGLIIAYDFGFAEDKIKTTGISINKKNHGGFWIAANAGMRIWISKKLAVNARLGFGTLNYSALDLGIDYKFDFD